MQPSYLQTKNWAEFKKTAGWQPHWLQDILILERSLPYLNRPMLYLPEVVLDANPTDFLDNLKKLGQDRKALFIRLELFHEVNKPITNQLINQLSAQGYKKSFEEVQPEWRQWLDITQSENDILVQMKPKGRYNIRVAERHKVMIIQGSGDQSLSQTLIKRFYSLYQETAKRDGFAPRPEDYFIRLAQTLGPKARILIAAADGIDLAGMILIIYGDLAAYLYGGSSSENRNAMAPYLLHWSAIKIAKQAGAKIYDLLAIAPPDRPQHKYIGLSRFKSQFGGREVHLAGSYDLILQPFWYRLFNLVEKIRRK